MFFIVHSLAGCTSKVVKDDRATKPNVIFILADDLGYGDLSIQNRASRISTPNIDEMAVAGVRFTDAHSPSSVCSPTRYGILTGRYSWRGRLQENVVREWDEPLIESGRLTLGNLFREAGYKTAFFGKWHLGWHWPVKEGRTLSRGDSGDAVDYTRPIGGGPLDYGFDHYFGDDVPNFPPYTFIEDDRVLAIPHHMKPRSMFGNPGVMADGWDLRKVMPAINDKAIEFIGRMSEEEKPFFAYLSLIAPHTPIAPAEEHIGSSNAGAYGDYVQQIDHDVGRVIETLRSRGVLGSTIIVLTSDNGSPGRDGADMFGRLGSITENYGHHPSSDLRGMKADIWEGGHRVPFIVHWPEALDGGRVVETAFSLTDLYATFADILRIDIPGDAAEDSLSILPLLDETVPKKGEREAIVMHSLRGVYAIRKGDWKLIQGCGGGGFRWKPCDRGEGWQLYNMESDPEEQENVLADHPGIVRELSDLLARYKEAEGSVGR